MSVYNEENYLNEAVNSILNQTFKDFEFLIINDGSTDRTEKILNSYADTRIKVIKNKTNIGLTRSLNKGLRIAKGKYIARQDADDISMPERLKVELNFLREHPNYGIVGSSIKIINEKNKIIRSVIQPPQDKQIRELLKIDNCINHGSVMVRKTSLDEVGQYDENMLRSQDYELWLRISKKYLLANLPEFLYLWRKHKENIEARNLAEQKIFVALAKVKNDISSLEKIAKWLINTITYKRKAIIFYPLDILFKTIELITLKKVKMLDLYHLLYKIMFLKRTIKILQDLDENRESFKGTKLKLEEISNKIFTQELIVNNFLSESNSYQKGLCIAVCVLFFEKVEQTIECIKSFLASGVNIYILNNGSSDKSRKTLGKFCGRYKQIKIFDSGKNLGVAVGRNYLITYTEEEWLLFIDNDIRIKTRNWLEKFREQISLHKDTEVFIPKLYNKRTRRYASKKFIEIEDNKAVINTEIQGEFSNCFPGGASFVNRKLFDRLGLYDKKMFIGLEDYELSIRGILQEKPIKAKIIEDIVLIHDHRLANKKEDQDAVNIRYNIDFTRNSINRIRKKHNILLVGDWISWCSKAQNRLLHNQKQSLKMRLTKLIPYKVRKIVKNFLKNSNNNLLF
jgi:glycosyltransferase involved in cell wall biosynthesis